MTNLVLTYCYSCSQKRLNHVRDLQYPGSCSGLEDITRNCRMCLGSRMNVMPFTEVLRTIKARKKFVWDKDSSDVRVMHE